MPTAEYQARWKRTYRAPDSPDALRSLARRLAAGDDWHTIARDQGTVAAELRRQVRAKVQPYVIAIMERDQPLPDGRHHGTRTAYVNSRCRCEACRYPNLMYQRQQVRRERRGEDALIDAAPVRDHILLLADAGIGSRRLADMAGLSRNTIQQVKSGTVVRVTDKTADAVLAVAAPPDFGEVHDHLRELVASGWTVPQIARESGVSQPTVYTHRNHVRNVSPGTAAALLAVEPLSGPLSLPAGPLVTAVRPHLSRLSETDRRAFYRGRRTGTVTDVIADRLSIAAGVGPLPLIYDLDDLEEEAA